MKYSRHPQKFKCKDPELQKEWEDLKDVLCDNEYMMGYKIMVGQKVSFKSVWNNLTTLHTDTSNIYSHLIAGIFFVWRSFQFTGRFRILNLVVSYTFFGSAFYHTFRNYSRKWYDFCLCFDVAGIGIQIFAFDFVDTISLFGEKHQEVCRMYLIVFAILSILSIGSVPFILKHKLYALRTFMFSAIAFTGYPLMYHAYKLGYDIEPIKNMLIYRIVTFVFQGLGLLFRSTHIPERWAPRTILQAFFHSHYFFHLCGAYGSYVSCLSSEALI